MSSTRVLIASVAILMLLAATGQAKDKKDIDAAQTRCMDRYDACLTKCDHAPNTTATIYKNCNESCDRKYNRCIKKSYELTIPGMSSPDGSIFPNNSLGSSPGDDGSSGGSDGAGGGGPGSDHSTGNGGIDAGAGGGIIY